MGSSGEPTTYDLVATINAYNGDTPVTSWQDEFSGKSSARKLFYKISASDINLHESAVSNYVWRYGKIPKIGNFNNEIAYEFELMNSYPNPFNPSTKIVYSLAEDSKVQIKVYDMLGTEVAELVNETKSAGFYEETFNASDLSSGVYIYRIIALKGDRILFSESKRMMLIK